MSEVTENEWGYGKLNEVTGMNEVTGNEWVYGKLRVWEVNGFMGKE